jgi:fructose-1,6-bisphosphatase
MENDQGKPDEKHAWVYELCMAIILAAAAGGIATVFAARIIDIAIRSSHP